MESILWNDSIPNHIMSCASSFIILHLYITFISFHCNLVIFLHTKSQSLRVYLPENLSTCLVHNRVAIIIWYGRQYFPKTMITVYISSHAQFFNMELLQTSDCVYVSSPWTWVDLYKFLNHKTIVEVTLINPRLGHKGNMVINLVLFSLWDYVSLVARALRSHHAESPQG